MGSEHLGEMGSCFTGAVRACSGAVDRAVRLAEAPGISLGGGL